MIVQELELKKPWMTDEIRNEIQKKNKLYAKAKKNKDAKEWEEFKDLRNKVTRMIRDAKNDYLAKHPEQVSFSFNFYVCNEKNIALYSQTNNFFGKLTTIFANIIKSEISTIVLEKILM